jgi:outer membrane protein assembly factor BamD (BamD/ComL family)/outer membrane protein assembly factor BamB
MISISAVAIIVLGVFGVWAYWKVHFSESSLSDQARADYDQGSFAKASEEFDQLAKKFPNSANAPYYRLMSEWSSVSSFVSDPDAEPSAAIDRLDQFIEKHGKEDLFKPLAHDAGQRLLKVAKSFAARNSNPPDEEPLKDAERIEKVRGMVASLDAAALTREELSQIEADLGQVRKAVETARKLRAVLAQLKKQDRETWMDAIKRSRSLLTSMERELPGIGQDPESQQKLSELYVQHLDSVKFYGPPDDPAPAPHVSEDDAPTLLFAPVLPSAAPGRAPPNDPIVLALVRGVLYALKQSTGELKWAIRVGIDTTVLPQRVPATAITPELLLVLSADTQTISALGVEGDRDPLWEYHVGQPVLGRPIIIGQRAYLADYTGWVHEIELSGGQLLGRWNLGQPLTRGGAREGDTSRIYFPADDSCIYVLDVNPKSRRCVTILYDGHPSGSLRSEPVIIAPQGDNSPGYLILNQSNGLDAMQLQVFELPLQDRHAQPMALVPPARLAGWTWFEPRQDGEKLAILSDAGILGLFGIRQVGNYDQPLFPLLQQGGLDLSPFLPSRRTLSRERGRSQVVHMQSDDLWVLARGQFQQVQLRWNAATGPQAKPGWKEPLTLGSPLHESQRIEDRNTGRSTFILVTQALEQQTCLASAVDEEGHIVWQRQLGLVCQGEPLILKPPGEGLPLLLALDRGGGLFALDPSFSTDKLRSCWRYLAPALAENPLVPPRLLLAADGRSAYEVAAPGDGKSLIIRHIEWTGNGRELRFTEHDVSLLSAAGTVLTPAGLPIVLGTKLLMALTDGTDGIVMRMSMEKDEPQTGPTWRATGAPTTATCSLLALSADRFLATDGSRGLNVWEWPPDKEYQSLPKDGQPLQLEHLVAAPPVLVPAVEGQQPRVAVADSAGVMHLFALQPDGSFKEALIWQLEGNLTAGPFVQAIPNGGWRIGCVLDRRNLLWIDPEKEKPLWTYSTDGPAIIGHPQWVDNMLVVALQSGRYVGIDPKTGKQTGPGYTLRTSAAPAVPPVSFGPGRLFTPLTDGTALMLSCDRLREPAKK